MKKPGVVVLVVDLSGSMARAKLAQAKEGAKRFLDAVAPHNLVGLVTFSDQVKDVVQIGPVKTNQFRLLKFQYKNLLRTERLCAAWSAHVSVPSPPVGEGQDGGEG